MVLVGDVDVVAGPHVVADLDRQVADDAAPPADQAAVADAHDRVGDALLARAPCPADSDTCGPMIVPGADADVALVDERRRREADHAAVAERTEAPAAPRPRPDRPELDWISSHPRWTSSPAPRFDCRRRPVPRRVGDRGPAQHAGRRYRPVAPWRRGQPAHASSRSATPTSLRAAASRPQWTAAARLAGAPTRPTSSCTPATSSTRIPTTPPTGRSPSACSTRSPSPYVVIPGNHDIGFFGEEADRPRRLADVPRPRGATTASASTSPAGASSAPTPTSSAPPSTTTGCATPWRPTRPVLAFVHQPLRGEPADGWEMPPPAGDAFERAIAGADVRVVASGHRHCSLTDRSGRVGAVAHADQRRARRRRRSAARRRRARAVAGRRPRPPRRAPVGAQRR